MNSSLLSEYNTTDFPLPAYPALGWQNIESLPLYFSPKKSPFHLTAPFSRIGITQNRNGIAQAGNAVLIVLAARLQNSNKITFTFIS